MSTVPIVRLVRPFQEFAARQASGGILLSFCTVAALAWANSRWAGSYAAFWHTRLAISLGSWTLDGDLHFWVNDALMAVFFFVVGLEIKRELMVGELASPRQAALPIMAALGGLVAPALIYSGFNAGGPGAAGWGIPMATDIAFAIGVMALLGERIPLSLKVFLTALAIVDDLAAVLVIAIFYTAAIHWTALGVGTLTLALLFALNRMGARHPLPYGILGLALWLAVLRSGVHSTIAGVALALAIPCGAALDSAAFPRRGRALLDHFEQAASDDDRHAAIEELEDACEKVQTPLHRLEHGLHPWVTFLVMPLFALANAGVALNIGAAATLAQPVPMGIVFGLLLGKPLGVMAASWLAVKLGFASLPAGIAWRHVHGAGWLAGIGFTMSLFVAGLAFGDDAGLLTSAKIGILAGSACAGIAGSVLLRRAGRAS